MGNQIDKNVENSRADNVATFWANVAEEIYSTLPSMSSGKENKASLEVLGFAGLSIVSGENGSFATELRVPTKVPKRFESIDTQTLGIMSSPKQEFELIPVREEKPRLPNDPPSHPDKIRPSEHEKRAVSSDELRINTNKVKERFNQPEPRYSNGTGRAIELP